MNIVLCTINPSIELAWREALVDFPALHPLCEILTGNITELAVDAVVSPANSFGFMDGGIDLHYSTVFGWHVQERLQAFIKTMAVQELPGIPREIVGISAPPTTALFAASGAAIPYGLPFPKDSLSSDARFASL